MCLEQRRTEHLCHDNSHDHTDDIHKEHNVCCIVGKEHRRKQCHDRQLRTARQERCDEDRDHAILFRVERTRTHNGRNGAAEAHHQRHDPLTRQPAAAHDRIRDKRDTRHVARAVEERETEEQDEDERNERQH